MSKLIFKDNEWTEESLIKMWEAIDHIAQTKYGLTHEAIRFEIVNYNHLLTVYTSGMPNTYSHWSFGKRFIENEKAFKAGRLPLAYEVVFNTAPVLTYLMDSNTALMQTLVMCHAAIGHANFYQNNFLFKEHTSPSQILQRIESGREFIEECEEKYGATRVEKLLDAAHALQLLGVDRGSKKRLSKKQVKERQNSRREAEDLEFNELFDTLSSGSVDSQGQIVLAPGALNIKKSLNEENILKFLSKHSLILAPWEKRILEIVDNMSKYFYPQIYTKMMNEGWASFWHYHLMKDLYDEGYIDESMYLEFIHSHTSVCAPQSVQLVAKSYLNPYKVGFSLFMEIKRMCESPTDEDRKLYPHIAGKNWVEQIKFAAFNFKDSTFVQQYLTPALTKELGLCSVTDDEDLSHYELSEVADADGYEALKHNLSLHYNYVHDRPKVFIRKVITKDRKLIIVHQKLFGHCLKGNEAVRTAMYLKELWGGNVDFELRAEDGEIIDMYEV